MRNRFLLLLVFLFVFISIVSKAGDSPVVIETQSLSLAFIVGEEGRLYQVYLGEKLNDKSDYLEINPNHEAYIQADSYDLHEPAIRMIHNDGNPSLELTFKKVETTEIQHGITHTIIYLSDKQYSVTVQLHYQAFYNEDIIETWTEIQHSEKSPVLLSDFASSMLHFDARHYWLSQFHGDHKKEMIQEEHQLTNGIKIIDSKLGTRANKFQSPAFFLSLNEPSTETTGELIGGTLAWTGNFQFLFEVDRYNSLRIISGMNPYASEYHLKPNEVFKTPSFIFSYSKTGKGQISRNFHRWSQNHRVLDGKGNRLTLLNNWESTFFDFNEEKLVDLFGQAKEIGVDLFLLDDGWFGNEYPRNDDKMGLGDWQENKEKLPHGISYLIEKAETQGVKFGIWIEPEMVNPKSELYEKNPDWVLKLPNREEHYYRNQLVLDMTNPEVQEFVYNVVDELLTSYPGIAFIKWDCNRMMTNTYSDYLGQNQSHIYIDYVKGFYKVLDQLRQKYPTLPIMLCSGGGGRCDYKALEYFTEFWPSDNTRALDRIFIQWGFSYFYPANTMCCHITSMGDESLKFKTDVAMMGKMGYDIRLDEMSEADRQFSKEALKTYNKIKGVIWFGYMYRLVSPYEENRAALMYVDESKERAVFFCYNLFLYRDEITGAIKLQGLDPKKKYEVREINKHPDIKSRFDLDGKSFSGDYLMKVGLNFPDNRNFTSLVVEISEVRP